MKFGIKSSALCPECTPENSHATYGIWDTIGNIATCTNCGFERPVYRRSPRKGINPSQQKAISKIRRFFDGTWIGDGREPKHIDKFEIKLTDYGSVWVRVTVDLDDPHDDNGMFLIGNRGSITVYSTFPFGINRMEHYAYMLSSRG